MLFPLYAGYYPIWIVGILEKQSVALLANSNGNWRSENGKGLRLADSFFTRPKPCRSFCSSWRLNQKGGCQFLLIASAEAARYREKSETHMDRQEWRESSGPLKDAQALERQAAAMLAATVPYHVLSDAAASTEEARLDRIEEAEHTAEYGR